MNECGRLLFCVSFVAYLYQDEAGDSNYVYLIRIKGRKFQCTAVDTNSTSFSYITTRSIKKVFSLHVQQDLSAVGSFPARCPCLFLKSHSSITRLVQAREMCASSEETLVCLSDASVDVGMWHQIGQKF